MPSLDLHWPALQLTNGLIEPGVHDTDNYTDSGDARYWTRVGTLGVPCDGFTFNYAGLGSPVLPGQPFTIIPTAELGLPIGARDLYGWYAQSVGSSIDIPGMVGAIDTGSDPHPAFYAVGNLFIVDDIAGFGDVDYPYPPPNDKYPRLHWEVGAQVKIVYTHDDRSQRIEINSFDDHYHNGYLFNYDQVDIGTDPVALDFTLLSVPAHHTLYTGCYLETQYVKRFDGAYQFPPRGNAGDQSGIIHIDVSIIVDAYNHFTGEQQHFEKSPDAVYYVYERSGGAAGKSSGGTPPGGAYIVGVDILNTRTGLYIATAALGVAVKKFATAFQPYAGGYSVDTEATANYPTLEKQVDGSGVICFYRVGDFPKPTKDIPKPKNTYRWRKRTSYDDGQTWKQEVDPDKPDDGEVEMLAGKKWAKMITLGDGKRARGELYVYNDGSGKDKDGNPDGTGLLMADLYDVTGKKIGTYPEDKKGICGKKVDDAGFGLEYINDSSHDVRVVFASGGSLIYAISVNEGMHWKDITIQMQ